MTAGERLRLAREAAGLTVKQVVGLTDGRWSCAVVEDLEAETAAIRWTRSADVFADLYGVSTAWLVDGIPNDLPAGLVSALDRLAEHHPEDAAIVRAFAKRMRARRSTQ